MSRLKNAFKWVGVRFWKGLPWLLVIVLSVAVGYLYWQHQKDERVTTNALNRVVDSLKHVDSRVDGLESNISSVESSDQSPNIDDISSRIDDVETRLSDMESNLRSIASDASGSDNNVDTGRIALMESKLNKLEDDIRELGGNVGSKFDLGDSLWAEVKRLQREVSSLK